MKKLPSGHSMENVTVVRSVADIGRAVKQARTQQNLKQLDLTGLANTGNRFLIELERGKPTIQLQKVLEILQLLGFEVILRKRGSPRAV